MIERFYSPDRPADGRLTLDEEEARHLSRVCRLGPGAQVEVFDGRGFATRAEVVAVRRDGVDLTITGAPIPEPVPPCRLTLATAIPKGERFDWLVEKATELGVSRLVPILTERSVVDPREAKLERLRRVIISASKQCGRNRLLELAQPTPWKTLLEEFRDPLRLIAEPAGARAGEWPSGRRGDPVALAVGPEGGFTRNERDAAGALSWRPVHLARNTLRIETAGVAGCAMILALAEGWTV